MAATPFTDKKSSLQMTKRGVDGIQDDAYKGDVTNETGGHTKSSRGILREKYDKESRRLEDMVLQVTTDLKNALQSSPE